MTSVFSCTSSVLSGNCPVDLHFHGWCPRKTITGAIQLISWSALRVLCGCFVKPAGNAYFFCKQSLSEAFICLCVLTLIHILTLTANLAERNCYTEMKCLIYGNVTCVENIFFSECIKRKMSINCSEFGGGSPQWYRLEHLPCKEGARDWGLCSLEKRWLQGDLTAVLQS